MGLSAMQNAPNFDQALRFANISGQAHYISPTAWVGEGNLNGLGLMDGDPSNTITAAGNAASQVIGAIGQLRNQKKTKTQPRAQPAQPLMQQMPAGDSSNAGKWLIYGGLAIGAVVVLMVVLKNKKKNGDRDKED